jgi:hypothetical protein
MAGFRKAKAEQAALKLGMYGPAGKGKTFSALLMAEGLAKITGKRVAFVDTERGTDFYCKAVDKRQVHPQAFDFDAIYTRSLTEINAEVRKLSTDEYAVIVIDSITHIWEAARAAYSGKVNNNGTLPFHAWGVIKKPYKDLINFLLSSPMHVILCGRQGNEFEEDEQTGETKKVGVKMKAEGETPYEPHILIRMETDRDKGGNEGIIAIAEKDRTGILAGQAIRLWPAPRGKEETHTFDMLVRPILPLLGNVQAKIDSDDETATKDSEALAKEEQERQVFSADQVRRFSAMIELADTADALKRVGDAITPEIKKRMVTAHVTELREKYREAEKRLPAAPPKAPEKEKPLDDQPDAAVAAAAAKAPKPVTVATDNADRRETARKIIEAAQGKPAPAVEEPANNPVEDEPPAGGAPSVEDAYMEWVDSLAAVCTQAGMHPDEFHRGLKAFLTDERLATEPWKINAGQRQMAQDSAKNQVGWWDFRPVRSSPRVKK